jgi:ABC-type uncharacterized transport system substrate-binding protein
MRRLKRTAIYAAVTLTALAAATPARVHPHVFADARLDVDVDAHGNVTALKHVWRFDDVFSSTVLVEFDKNADLKLDDAELQDVSNTVYESLAEYGYFQIVTLNGKDVAMQKPEALIANFENNQLIILFQSAPKEPLKLAGKVDFGIYDPTFYTAIDFVEDDQMAVNGMPATCKRAVIRPDPDEALAQNQQNLTDAFFNDPSGTDMSKIFATRLELTCPG